MVYPGFCIAEARALARPRLPARGGLRHARGACCRSAHPRSACTAAWKLAHFQPDSPRDDRALGLEAMRACAQARFMLAKLNPSATHDTPAAGAGPAGEVILTDDVSLAVFQQHLARLAVQS